MFKVIFSPKAWDDFFDIFEYIAADDPVAASRFCDALLNHAESLGTFPHIGIASRKSRGVRSVLHTPVRIYYRVDEERQGLEIMHFWHTARRTPQACKPSMSNASALVSKLWSYCHILRDDGLSYGDYVEQLTFLLFLKMAHERTLPPRS